MQSLAALFRKKQEEVKVVVLDDKAVLYAAQNVVVREYGAVGARNITPTFYKDKKLFLRVSGSIWKSELELTRSDLKKAVNAECGQKAVEEITIKTA